MAQYRFKCMACQKTFDVKATLEEKERRTFPCPSCSSKRTKSQFSLTSFFANIFSKDTSAGDGSQCSTKDGKGGCC